jgi:hypothetical protein
MEAITFKAQRRDTIGGGSGAENLSSKHGSTIWFGATTRVGAWVGATSSSSFSILCRDREFAADVDAQGCSLPVVGRLGWVLRCDPAAISE